MAAPRDERSLGFQSKPPHWPGEEEAREIELNDYPQAVYLEGETRAQTKALVGGGVTLESMESGCALLRDFHDAKRAALDL